MGRSMDRRSFPLAKNNQRTAGVPIADCLNGGVHPRGLCLNCARADPTPTHSSQSRPNRESHCVWNQLAGLSYYKILEKIGEGGMGALHWGTRQEGTHPSVERACFFGQ